MSEARAGCEKGVTPTIAAVQKTADSGQKQNILTDTTYHNSSDIGKKMHTIELHEMMPRSQLIPKTIRHTDSLDLEQLDDIANYGHHTQSIKPIECWTSDDIANWLIGVSRRIDVDFTQLCGEKFVLSSGTTLLNMTEREFMDITPEFGKDLYVSIKQHQMETSSNILTPACSNYLARSDIIKPVEQWNNSDIADWLVRTSKEIRVDYTELCGEKFVHLSGSELLDMKEKDFLAISPEHGKQLYISLQCAQVGGSSLPPWRNDVLDLDSGRSSLPSYEDGNGSDSENSRPPSGLSKPVNAEDFNPPGTVQKRKRGRPSNPNKKGKKKQENSFGRLWEFLRDLLKNPDTCPRIIKWENHDDGLFRFVQSDEVAKIWGRRKGNKQMTYEKLSRAMRYYYKSDVLQAVVGRRLVYRFGPNATDWRVPDPNFERRRNCEAMMRQDTSATP